jgi:hypothetical protein
MAATTAAAAAAVQNSFIAVPPARRIAAPQSDYIMSDRSHFKTAGEASTPEACR